VIVYCRSLNSCADLYAHFHNELGNDSYYPHLSDHRLFGMYHSNTPQYKKDVILKGLTQPDGVVKKLFLLPLLWEWLSICVTLTPSYIMVPRTVLTTPFRRLEEEDLVVMHILLCIGSLLTVRSEKT